MLFKKKTYINHNKQFLTYLFSINFQNLDKLPMYTKLQVSYKSLCNGSI